HRLESVGKFLRIGDPTSHPKWPFAFKPACIQPVNLHSDGRHAANEIQLILLVDPIEGVIHQAGEFFLSTGFQLRDYLKRISTSFLRNRLVLIYECVGITDRRHHGLSINPRDIVRKQELSQLIMSEKSIVSLPLQKEHARRTDALTGMQLQVSGLLASPYHHPSSVFATDSDSPLPRPAHRRDQSAPLPLQVEEGQLPIHMVGAFKNVMSQTEFGAGDDFLIYRKKIVRPSHASVGVVQHYLSGSAGSKLQVERQDFFDDRRVPCARVAQTQDALDRRDSRKRRNFP